MKPRIRDYIDLYFIMQKYNYSLEKLILDAKAKFDWHIDKINLISQFTRIKDFEELEFPKMLVPFNTFKFPSVPFKVRLIALCALDI